MLEPENLTKAGGESGTAHEFLWNSRVLNLCKVGRQGQPLCSTPAFRQLLGWEEGPTPAIEIEAIIHPEDKIEFRQFFNRHLTPISERPRGVFRLKASAGRIIPVELQIEPVYQNGEVQSLLLIFRDFDPAQFLSPAESDELEKFLATASGIIESLLDAVMIVSVEGRIVQVNESLLELLGRRRFELVGMPVGALFAASPEEVSKASARFARIMKYGKVREVDVKVLSKSGETISVSLNGSVIRSQNNELLGVVAMLRDLRQNKLMRELSRKNQELELANEELKKVDGMKDDLISLVGHELRAPLSNILGYSEFLTEDSLPASELKEFSRIIHQESQRLARLVNDILDLSRMEAGKLVYHYVPFSLNRVIENAAAACQNEIQAKRQRLELQLDPALPELEFDPDRIQQVVVNMLTNASKYSPEDTGIRVKSRTEAGGARVEVEDEGIGIAAENSAKVFAKFEQIEDVRKHSGGAGLGMPIAKLIIEDGHGGTMGFESLGSGRGSTFYFLLPGVKRR
jgi:PAS domain S-box-containing protein